MVEIFSIGHSNQEYTALASRLKAERITALADVRSSPFSRHYPQFNRPSLKASLAKDKIAYAFIGKELGGRPDRPTLFSHGVADYEKMSREASFRDGLERLETGARDFRIAMMCSERHPLDCHRCLLVGRALKLRGHIVRHLLPTENWIDQDDVEARLLEEAGNFHDDMFIPYEIRLNSAYRKRADRVAFRENSTISEDETII